MVNARSAPPASAGVAGGGVATQKLRSGEMLAAAHVSGSGEQVALLERQMEGSDGSHASMSTRGDANSADELVAAAHGTTGGTATKRQTSAVTSARTGTKARELTAVTKTAAERDAGAAPVPPPSDVAHAILRAREGAAASTVSVRDAS